MGSQLAKISMVPLKLMQSWNFKTSVLLIHIFITDVLLKIYIFCYAAQFKRQCFVHDAKLMTLADPYDEGMNFESDSINSTVLIIYDLFVVYHVYVLWYLSMLLCTPAYNGSVKKSCSVKGINHKIISKTY